MGWRSGPDGGQSRVFDRRTETIRCLCVSTGINKERCFNGWEDCCGCNRIKTAYRMGRRVARLAIVAVRIGGPVRVQEDRLKAVTSTNNNTEPAVTTDAWHETIRKQRQKNVGYEKHAQQRSARPRREHKAWRTPKSTSQALHRRCSS